VTSLRARKNYLARRLKLKGIPIDAPVQTRTPASLTRPLWRDQSPRSVAQRLRRQNESDRASDPMTHYTKTPAHLPHAERLSMSLSHAAKHQERQAAAAARALHTAERHLTHMAIRHTRALPSERGLTKLLLDDAAALCRDRLAAASFLTTAALAARTATTTTDDLV